MIFRIVLLSVFQIICLSSIALCENESDALRVVTYNIRYANKNDGADVWDHRADSVAKYLATTDIAGLQEVTPGQLEYLREKLDGDFDSYGVGRDDGKHKGEHAPIFYRRDRFKLIEKSTFWLSSTPDEMGSKGWDAALPRTVTWMLLRDKKTEVEFVVANTHFDHRGAEARAESGKLIRERLKSVNKDVPIIVMGDFNCLPDSLPYQNLTSDKVEGSPLQDARLVTEKTADGPSGTWNGFKEIANDKIIDHLFVRGPARVLQFQIENPKTPAGRFASDHLPVRLHVQFKSE